jgi:hypothetical protein
VLIGRFIDDTTSPCWVVRLKESLHLGEDLLVRKRLPVVPVEFVQNVDMPFLLVRGKLGIPCTKKVVRPFNLVGTVRDDFRD